MFNQTSRILRPVRGCWNHGEVDCAACPLPFTLRAKTPGGITYQAFATFTAALASQRELPRGSASTIYETEAQDTTHDRKDLPCKTSIAASVPGP
jgi:hypothetical protein